MILFLWIEEEKTHTYTSHDRLDEKIKRTINVLGIPYSKKKKDASLILIREYNRRRKINFDYSLE